MKLTQEYRRVQAQWGSDGDFITPEGKIIHAGENHTLFMMDHPEMFGGSHDPEELVGQGWVQTRGIGGTFSINASGGMNETQLYVLQKMIRERSRYSDPRLEVLMDNDSVYELTCDEFEEIEYPNQIKRRGLRSSAKGIPFITKEDLRLTREGDPWTDKDWISSGLKRLMSYGGEHFSYTGEKKKDEKGRDIFLYRAGRKDLWITKDRQIYREH